MFAFKMATLLHYYIVSLITVVHASHIKMLKFFLPCMTISYKIGAQFQIYLFIFNSQLFHYDQVRKSNSHRTENVSSKISVISDSKNYT